ncbi:unnamed protein product, partial [Closterium sp. Naga37s-1]
HSLEMNDSFYDAFTSGVFLFARKFPRDSPTLDKIDRELLQRQPDSIMPGAWCSLPASTASSSTFHIPPVGNGHCHQPVPCSALGVPRSGWCGQPKVGLADQRGGMLTLQGVCALPKLAVFLKDCRKAWGKAVQGWAVGADCGAIPELSCDNSGMITMMFPKSKLNGPIPDSISSLTALTFLNLSDKNLTGSIPNGISNLFQLCTLVLENNNLMGSIPSDIQFLSQLDDLSLSSNSLMGSIPSDIFSLRQLAFLNLANNNLTGSIPNNISELSRLDFLSLANNRLTGTIPNSIAELSQLSFL